MKNNQTKQCPQCGNDFTGRPNKIYCGTKCKMAAFYAGEQQEHKNSSVETVTKTDLRNVNTKKSVFNKDNPPAVTITISLTGEEKQFIEAEANSCGVSIADYIKVKATLPAPNTSEYEIKISELAEENKMLRVKLSAAERASIRDNILLKEQLKKRIGIFVEMNEAQKNYLHKEFLKSYDFDGDDKLYLQNGSYTFNYSEYLVDQEKLLSGTLEKRIAKEMINALLWHIEERYIDIFDDYSEEDFEDDHSLVSKFNYMKRK